MREVLKWTLSLGLKAKRGLYLDTEPFQARFCALAGGLGKDLMTVEVAERSLRPLNHKTARANQLVINSYNITVTTVVAKLCSSNVNWRTFPPRTATEKHSGSFKTTVGFKFMKMFLFLGDASILRRDPSQLFKRI